MFKEMFIEAIQDKIKLKVTFFSKDDGGYITRTCAPMDYGQSRHTNTKDDRYHLWDYDSSHTLSLPITQVKNIEHTEQSFDPAEFLKWPTNWIIRRDWGKFS
ncbi:MAG: hypothetical protein NT166_06885 [Candidatus Aminicenantes bacterium]|nr:hypothetical protein [Candidatus Aminicenantes bacterium]